MLPQKKMRLVGLMSGTSLDGIDLCCADFSFDEPPTFQLINTAFYPYNNIWKKKLAYQPNIKLHELETLQIDFAQLMASVVQDFVEKNSIQNIDYISSHGHTLFHEPEKGITLQVGDGQILSNLTGFRVVCDFRTQDVQMGGQGAPLVPIGDAHLFSDFDVCLNLGGFGNLSFDQDGQRKAYDLAAVNLVLNHYAQILGKPYDENGKMATQGQVQQPLIEALNELKYYKIKGPKSLGAEWVHRTLLPLIDSFNAKPEDVLHTYCIHLGQQFSENLKSIKAKRVLVTGGGAYHRFLIEKIKSYSTAEIIIPSKELTEYKEALVFAYLGFLRIQNRINCLRSVTGAKHDHSSGQIISPQNLS